MAEEFISVASKWEVIYLLTKLRINVVKLSDNVTEVRGPYFHNLFSLILFAQSGFLLHLPFNQRGAGRNQYTLCFFENTSQEAHM